MFFNYVNRLKRLLHHPVLRNAAALYGLQMAGYVLPLVTVPYLARVLGPVQWGQLLLAQAFGLWLMLWVEYGFNLSATREIAQRRSDQRYVAELVSGVMGAKAALIVGSAVVAVLARQLVPAFRADPHVLWWAWAWGAAQGLSPIWYFQGNERMQLPATLDICGKLLTTIAVFIVVRVPADGWVVIALQAAGNLLTSLIALLWMYREVPMLRPTWSRVWRALRTGASMFLFRSAVSLYTSLNAFILGLFVAPALVSYFGGADRINRAMTGLLGPISQALYPRMNHLAVRDGKEAARLARLSLAWIASAALLGSLLMIFVAPQIVHILLGAQYAPVVPVLRVLSLLLPLIAVSNVMGMQWMVPFGMDRAFNIIIISAGLINIVLAPILAPRAGAQGMAWAIVFSEAFVTGAMWYQIARSGNKFWGVEAT